MSLRLKDTWRLILSSTLGFTLGGMVMGLLVNLANPTSGYRTAPVLTWIVLVLALAAPFAFGGGALGQTYGRLAKRAAEKGEPPEALQPSRWQTGIVAVIGLLGVVWFLGIVDHITDFLTINPGNSQTVITRETVGVQWSDPEPYSGGIEFPPAAPDAEMRVSVTGPDGSLHSAWCTADGAIQYQLDSGSVESITFPGCSGATGACAGVRRTAACRLVCDGNPRHDRGDPFGQPAGGEHPDPGWLERGVHCGADGLSSRAGAQRRCGRKSAAPMAGCGPK
jgi:hypothetical protein